LQPHSPGVLTFPEILADGQHMTTQRKGKKVERCVYIEACYLAEELRCFGYKTDCPLYQESTGELYNQARFDEAMDKLINKTIAKYQRKDD
jgi:hypothetical protein